MAAFTLGFLVLGSGCSNIPDKVQHLSEISSSVGQKIEIKGWFSGSREFQFYTEKNRVGELYNDKCVSGVLSSAVVLEEFLAVRGRRVNITAAVGESELYMQETLGFFHNYCDQPYFLIVSDFELSE